MCVHASMHAPHIAGLMYIQMVGYFFPLPSKPHVHTHTTHITGILLLMQCCLTNFPMIIFQKLKTHLGTKQVNKGISLASKAEMRWHKRSVSFGSCRGSQTLKRAHLQLRIPCAHCLCASVVELLFSSIELPPLFCLCRTAPIFKT